MARLGLREMQMFQSFEVTARPEQGPPRLAALRAELAREGLDGFLVPRADAHQGEYVAPHDERLAWLTGFTGTAGFCVTLRDVAGVFVDGRYRTQVKAQVAEEFTPVPWPEVSLADWLKRHLPEGGKVGFDPWLHTAEEIEKIREAVGDAISVTPVQNLIDAIWTDRPAPRHHRQWRRPRSPCASRRAGAGRGNREAPHAAPRPRRWRSSQPASG